MSRFRSTKFQQPKNGSVQKLAFKKGDSLCNICGKKNNLTDDHIPPRCCGNDKTVFARRIYGEELVARQVDAKSHNGLKWRTLCKTCNGDVVGRWDPALGELSKQLEAALETQIVLPTPMLVNVRAGAVLRSLLGHVVAAKTQGDAVPMDSKIRSYLLGLESLSSTIQVYLWLYPFRPIVVSRDFTWVEIEGEGGENPGLATAIKFYPISTLVLDATGKGSIDARYMTPLHQYASLGDSETASLSVWREPIIHPGWPERPMGNHFVIGGRTYIDSVTTSSPGSASVTRGKQIHAESWPGGDPHGLFNGLHAFGEIPDLKP